MDKNKSSPPAGETATATSQKPVLPKIRYHPTIKCNQPGDGVLPQTSETPKTSKKHQKRRGKAKKVPPPQPGNQCGDAGRQVDKGPVSTDQAQITPKPAQKPVRKEASDSELNSNKGPPSPEQVPLGLDVVLDRHVVEQVEDLTRGQRENQHWFSWRKNRITASVAHQIAHCRFVNGNSTTPPSSYLAAVTGDSRRVQTRAMSWGINMESKVVQKYQKMKTQALGRPIVVRDCGLFIDAQRPWLAASPDGIVVDSRTGEWLLGLEVKCPYKHRESSVEEACRSDRAFCLEIEEGDDQTPGMTPVYRLKKSHPYFTQIQCQLAVTGMHSADLVVYTTKETAIVPVNFDPDLWEETVSKLEIFYGRAVLPKLREKAAAWKPEQ